MSTFSSPNEEEENTTLSAEIIPTPLEESAPPAAEASFLDDLNSEFGTESVGQQLEPPTNDKKGFLDELNEEFGTGGETTGANFLDELNKEFGAPPEDESKTKLNERNRFARESLEKMLPNTKM